MQGESNLVGTRLGSYEILERLGQGGFGQVYKGKHISSNNIVAIKVLLDQNDPQRDGRALLLQEARTLQQLKHSYVLPLIGVDDEQGILYMVMEYASGGTLQERLRKHHAHPFPMQEALAILFQIGQALHFAHLQENPIVHRDLKPANILFNTYGEAVLADFGLATALSNGKTVRFADVTGTWEYMAPEQFLGDVSVKSDQYALGCIAYELLTGKYPFDIPDKSSPPEKWAILNYQHHTVFPIPPSKLNPHISPSLSDAILKAMAKDRAERHENVSAFVTMLQEHLSLRTFNQWYTEGNTLYENGQYVKAIKAYRQATLLKPDFADVYVNTGIAHYDLRQYEQAVSVLEQAIHHKPDHAKAHYYKGLSLSELGRYDEAAEAYRRTIRHQPDHPYVYQDLGDTLCKLNYYEEAVAVYEKAVQLHPDDVEIYNDLGLAWRKCGNWKKAIQAFERAIQINPRLAKVHVNKGNTHYEYGEYQEALEEYDWAIRLQPQFANAYYGRSNALSKLGRFHEAALAEKQAYLHGYKG